MMETANATMNLAAEMTALNELSPEDIAQLQLLVLDHVAVTLFETTQDVSTFANDPSSFYAGGDMVVDLPGNSILQVGGQVFFGDGGMSGYEGTFSVDARF